MASVIDTTSAAEPPRRPAQTGPPGQGSWLQGGFHNALYDSMSLASKAVTAGRMLQRLDAATSAELTAIESIERRPDENRRIRYAVAVGFVSAVAIPASLVLAYLGINASQVNSDR